MKLEIKYLEFTITDKNGKDVKNGDDIFVQLPSMESGDGINTPEYYVSEKLIKANIRLQLSKGLVVKVLEIINPGDADYDEMPLNIGQRLCFKRIAWDWWK